MSEANLAQVMQAIPFHNSNIIFDTQSVDPGAPVDASKEAQSGVPATESFKSVYGGWTAVENASIALSESATLILLPRNCRNGKPAPVDQEDFKKYAQGLVDAGKVSLAAAKAKDLDKMIEAAGVVTEACAACHMVYRDFDDEKDRCTPPAAK
jgi:hypothetical protein